MQKRESKALKQLHRMFAGIPVFECIKGCTACCGVVHMTTIENEAIPETMRKPVSGKTCQYLGDGCCSIYEYRPYLCRIFGTADVPNDLRCPYGRRPEHLLSEETLKELNEQYRGYMRKYGIVPNVPWEPPNGQPGLAVQAQREALHRERKHMAITPERREEIRLRLRALYSEIPSFPCEKGCTACCGVPPMTMVEFENFPPESRLKLRHLTGPCPLMVQGQGCSAHLDRPLICRLFGSVDMDGLRCPKGCKPDKPLSAERRNAMLDEYRGYVEEVGGWPSDWKFQVRSTDTVTDNRAGEEPPSQDERARFREMASGRPNVARAEIPCPGCQAKLQAEVHLKFHTPECPHCGYDLKRLEK